ncbi:isoprenylcysteine carboxylmethyltransferase family protein [Marinobacter sp. MW3]|nr:isoprenylcysteine carboxylmethyltransferase family protein [Marinobacter sp. MC3]MBL3891664.1 isoprenylcysteine carboxylmethyltransferase family protein [Marinobacter sp. MW3]
MWALSRISPDFSIAIPAAGWVALGIALVGMAIAILGVLAFRTAGTTVDPRVPDQSESLVVSGIYRYSRNPMYLGFLMVLCAWGFWLGNVPALLFLPAFVLYINRFQIAPEERFMREKFGDAFTRYCTGVRRWL